MSRRLMVSELLLVIGNKNLSSWSMRPWVCMRHFGIPFTEEKILLDRPDTAKEIMQWSPSGKVPALVQGKLVVHDSLAIIEYCADLFPEKNIWPVGKTDRALARSVSAEMHSSFANLRREMPMNLTTQHAWKDYPASVMQDIARILVIWKECLDRSQGQFLFGEFCAADAMYAPVVTRLLTYSYPMEDRKLANYMQKIRALPAVEEWYAGAKEEV